MSINFHLSPMQFSIPCSHKIHIEILIHITKKNFHSQFEQFSIADNQLSFMFKNVLLIQNIKKHHLEKKNEKL